VIDGSTFFRGLLAEVLEEDGHEVLGADRSSEVTALLEEEDAPDLVLLDLGVDGGQGRRLLSEIRARHPPAALPVLILTEIVASAEDLERLAELGCDGVLNKLAPPDRLRERVRSALHVGGVEQRAHRRVSLSLGVRWREVGSGRVARTRGLSADGTFVCCPDPPPLGTRVELQVEIDSPPRRLLLAGEVVRREEASRGPDEPAGFALRFTTIAPSDRRALAEFLARVERSGF
jgi:CheY-like chemotaxis protein